MSDKITQKSERVGQYVRIYFRGASWYANYQRDKQQHRESLKTDNKKVALRKAAQINAEITAGSWKAPIARFTVIQVAESYIATCTSDGLKPSTLKKYGTTVDRIVTLADLRRVDEVNGLDLSFMDAYRKMRSDAGISPVTRHNECVVFRQLIRFAISRNMLATDTMKGLKLVRPIPAPQPCWTEEETGSILIAAPAELRPVFTILAETGMRVSELFWLTWDDIDLKSNKLWVRAKEGWSPKRRDRRWMPLSPDARVAIESLPRKWKWVVTMPSSYAHTEPGRQWDRCRLLRGLKKILKPLGLVGKLHTFRHAFISRALLKNTPVALVREWVGHVDPHVIDLYTHVHDAASQAGMAKMTAKTKPSGTAS
jgi:integrase